jgi:hypothetical protein
LGLDTYQNLKKFRLRKKAHGSISIQKGQPLDIVTVLVCLGGAVMIRFGARFGEFVFVMFAAAKARVEGMKAAPRNPPLSGSRACVDGRCAEPC